MEVMGVYEEALVEPLAKVLFNLGVMNAMVVYGLDKLDEISISAETKVCEIRNGVFNNYMIEPEQFGFERCKKEELEGGEPKENAAITLAIFNGELGPRRNAVVMNSGAALYIAGKCNTMEEGVRMAENLIDSGKAMAQLEAFIKFSNE